VEVGQHYRKNELSIQSTLLNSMHPEHTQFSPMVVSWEPHHKYQGSTVMSLKHDLQTPRIGIRTAFIMSTGSDSHIYSNLKNTHSVCNPGTEMPFGSSNV
jgi:hypothetical protein